MLSVPRPFSVARLDAWLNSLAARPTAHAAGSILIVIAGIATVSSAAGLIAGLLGTMVERVWEIEGSHPPAAWLLKARRRRWDNVKG